jgi:hypothetical protein
MLRLVGDIKHQGGGGNRFSISLAGRTYWLTYQSFVMLVHLAVALRKGDGWMIYEAHPYPNYRWHHIYRLRQELREQGNQFEIIENNKVGAYRLIFHPDAIALKTDQIIESLELTEGTFLHKCLKPTEDK